ncbi:transcription initiation factor TFIID component TAF4 family-domain-containing protein [Mycena rebaudengoi]|nr:transcription initiation factor TFIID component TAF4 family-domain-containing protein [Mycena rebaudengoi]KAJ7263116.1 transcription initiation factor TFIID component TAF4 family-domain-containing protein [Mycena rebaudengoi]
MNSGIPSLPAELFDSLIPIDADAGDSEPVQTTVPVPTPAPAPPTPAQTYQHYQGYAHHHYPQPAYQAYQYAPPPPPQAAPQPSMARQATANAHAQQSANTGIDTADLATLNDALGSAGIDIRASSSQARVLVQAEEEGLQRPHEQNQPFRPYEDRSKKQSARPNVDVGFLGATMRTIAAHHKVASVPEESVNYLALALRARLQDLVTAMIRAARHRTDAQFDRPASLYDDGSAVWGILVRSDIAKQLAALEKVERAEETRAREVRTLREDAVNAALSAVLAGRDEPFSAPADDHATRKRPKKAAMSEDVGRKMVNMEASRAAGIAGKYAWMTVGNNTAGPKPAGAGAAPAGAAETPPPREGNGWARPYKTTNIALGPPPLANADQRMPITIRDAMFIVEKERGHGGGRGSAKGWT